jgi:MEMO1 family protein
MLRAVSFKQYPYFADMHIKIAFRSRYNKIIAAVCGARTNAMYRIIALLLAITGILSGCGSNSDQQSGDGPDQQPKTFANVRGTAVAGMFYPAGKKKLTNMVDGLMGGAKPLGIKGLRGLVCPHAGYRFSGKTAAAGYKQLEGRDIRTAIVLAPSHYAMGYSGASIPEVEAYRTPLGDIELSPLIEELIGKGSFLSEPACIVQRPGWWRQARKEIPPFGQDTPHTWEHSLEVQLPFLQRTLKDFKLVPAVLRDADTEQLARTLAPHVSEKTIVIASSDLSHHNPYDTARKMDAQCVKAICELDTNGIASRSACGAEPVLTLMHLAKIKGWKTRLLEACNSGDTAGNTTSVVGYAAIAFYDPNASDIGLAAASDTYGPAERKRLMKLARQTLVQVTKNQPAPKPDASQIPKQLLESKACFVTLKKSGELRGCIGGFFPSQPLYQAVLGGTVSAAMKDPRFKPVTPDELDKIEIEISVLTVPKPLKFDSPEDLLAKLRPHVDGVILRKGQRQSTYLPQVWAQMPDKETFLSQLSKKARMDPQEWRKPGLTVLTYQVEAFHEHQTLGEQHE